MRIYPQVLTSSIDSRELTKRGRRRLRGLHLKIQIRVQNVYIVTDEELNWYEWVGSVERELEIHCHVLTSSTEA